MTPNYDFPVGTSHKDPVFRKIEQMISGYRGYDSIEDMRSADRQIRDSLASQMGKIGKEAENSRKYLETKTHLSIVLDFDEMVREIENARRELEGFENRRMAACRYYTPREDVVSRVYALDFKMLSDAENIFNLMQEFTRIGRDDLIKSNIVKITMSVEEIVQSLREKDQHINCMIR